MYYVTEACQVFGGTTVVGSIITIGALICDALLYSVCDLKAAQMNLQHCLIRDWAKIPWKLTKTFILGKVYAQLMTTVQ